MQKIKGYAYETVTIDILFSWKTDSNKVPTYYRVKKEISGCRSWDLLEILTHLNKTRQNP